MTRAVSGHVPTPSRWPRQLGRTGLPVSRLGLGLAALGRPAYMTLGRDADLGRDRSAPSMCRRCHAVLDAAYFAGIRYFDAARSYGLAEQFLASWCERHQLPDGAITVGSKWGYVYMGGWRLNAHAHEIKRLTVGTLRRQAIESRAILGRRLSIYQIHSATIESGVLEDRAVRGSLAQLRRQGIWIGLSVTGPNQSAVIRRALEIRVDGHPLFTTVQATWNLLEPSAGPALADASAAGLGVIVKEALANGRLTNRHASPGLRELRLYADRRETTIETLALGAALAQPWADVVLSGATSPEQLGGHLEALSPQAPTCPSMDVAEPPSLYWEQRSRLPWS
jgi:aryl-alcohol dehydrogenase-like predicted oxidoreductase